jgi:uncharacterized protein (TIGR00251 family)
VRVAPVVGLHGSALSVRLAAAPVDGAANEALIELLSVFFGVPKRSVRIVSGAAGRNKIVEMEGIELGGAR